MIAWANWSSPLSPARGEVLERGGGAIGRRE
jgi:hypothetical protein